ncbi:hypothetical protein GGR51DRAFT_525292 [Nemania sp. FL0031]|nr:hypothetical protein GGR51DRAFT_525292 [Nemania sp. FL0031]
MMLTTTRLQVMAMMISVRLKTYFAAILVPAQTTSADAFLAFNKSGRQSASQCRELTSQAAGTCGQGWIGTEESSTGKRAVWLCIPIQVVSIPCAISFVSTTHLLWSSW